MDVGAEGGAEGRFHGGVVDGNNILDEGRTAEGDGHGGFGAPGRQVLAVRSKVDSDRTYIDPAGA